MERPVSRLRALAGSLKLRLALASMLLIGAAVALTVVLVQRGLEARTQRAVLDAESADAERYAALVSARLVRLQSALRDGAAQLPQDRLGDAAALDRFIADEAVLRGLFDTLFVLDADGRLLVNADGSGVHPPGDYVLATATDRGYYRDTVRRRRPVVSEPITGRDRDEPQVVLTMPVFDRSGRLVALLCGGMRLWTNTLLSDITRASGDAHDPVRTVVVDTRGRIVAHPDTAWIFQDVVAEPRFAAAAVRWQEQGEPVDPQGDAARIGEDVVAWAGVPDADWVVFRSAPAELLLGGPAAGRREAVRIGAGVALAGGLVILVVTFALLRPLRRLEARARRLLVDDIAPEDGWPRGGGGELGELARVFRHVMQERAAAQRQGQALFEKMQAVLARAPIGIAFSRHGRVELASAEFARMFGRVESATLALPMRALFPGTDAEQLAFVAAYTAAFDAGCPFDVEREGVCADGSRLWLRLQGAPVRAGDPDAGSIWTFIDVTESRRQHEQLTWTATHDGLTGLANRGEFERRLAEALHDAGHGRRAAALFIDLDRFKAVNDAGGHAAGDAMLRGVSAVLAGRVRAEDVVARVGGDEFALLLRGCGPRAAERIAREICGAVAEHRLGWNEGELGVGASVGVVEIDASFDNVEAVLHAADQACYAAKHAGRGAVRVHRAAPNAQAA